MFLFYVGYVVRASEHFYGWNSGLELGLIFRHISGPDPFSDQCSDMYSERLLWVAVFEFRISFFGDIVLGIL